MNYRFTANATRMVAGVLLANLLWAPRLLAQQPLPPLRGDAPFPARQQEDPSVIESNLIEEVIEPQLVLDLDPTRSKIVRTKYPVHRIAITDPDIMDLNQFGPNEFEFIGKRSGETALTVWFKDENGEEHLLRYLVRVNPDDADQERAELEYGRLEKRINEFFPNSQVQLIPLIDKLIVRGQARDSEEVTQIMSIIRGQSNASGSFGFGFGGGTLLSDGSVARIPGAEDLPQARIVNLLTVPGEQQVMLKVRVAELTRNSGRSLGVDLDVIQSKFSIQHMISGGGNLTAILDDGDVSLFIKAVNGYGHGKILAEPTLVTLSGRTATFIAGGEFPVPTAVGIGGIGAASTYFRGFGTQLSFTPSVIDKDRIRLQVAPSFSSLNSSAGVNGIPGLDTRAVSTTVDLREGQWLAIAGLIQDEQGGSRTSLFGLGSVPVLGGLFGTQQVSRDETELIVLVSPELVHPLAADQVPFLLPGMEVTEVTDHDFFWNQQVEGQPNRHHRSTVFPAYQHQARQANWDAIRMAKQQIKLHSQFNRQQQHYISGPVGFSR
ncbi:MAG: pilus assembly protein N-terminal domain-containing protein [Planctomycetota bacterium]|nr:pilus assembly protein N-terminal domain-containing protein [Planctomycetota bacterium]